MTADPFCCELARDGGAPLAGTASTARVWIGIEEPAPWVPRAAEEQPLPQRVRRWIDEIVASVEGARAVLITDGSRPVEARRFWAARSGPTGERGAWSATAALDAAPPPVDRARLVAGEGPGEGWEPLADDLWLVCTHGQRDRCCARHGAPLWRALVAEAGPRAAVWQSSHLGGHRYAAGALLLPTGVSYGYLRAEDAPALLEASRRGRILLDRYRGRVPDSEPEQAADVEMRRRHGWTGVDDLAVERSREEGEDLYGVALRHRDGRRWRVVVRRSRERVLVSCTPAKVKGIDRWTLDEIVELP